MKLTVLAIIFIVSGLILSVLGLVGQKKTSPLESVVLLKSEKGFCSGVYVKSPRHNRSYILTAGHCRDLMVSNSMEAYDESYDVEKVNFVAEDLVSDLMLLSTRSKKSIQIQEKISTHDRVYTLSHGSHYPTYRTDGELLEIRQVNVIKGLIPPMTEKECLKSPKYIVQDVPPGLAFLGPLQLCVESTYQMHTTAWVVPGSSGGPVFSEDNKLVGIISATSPPFSTIVPSVDVLDFLSNF